jgi:hypothetical protein
MTPNPAFRIGYPAHMPAPPVRKISETILDFGEPLVSQLEADAPRELWESTLEIVITVWNAHVTAMPRWGQPQFLADLHARLSGPDALPELVDAVRTLSQRRLELFASDARAVGGWRLVGQRGAWGLRCDARAPIESR